MVNRTGVLGSVNTEIEEECVGYKFKIVEFAYASMLYVHAQPLNTNLNYVGIMLDCCLRRRPNIKPTSTQQATPKIQKRAFQCENAKPFIFCSLF